MYIGNKNEIFIWLSENKYSSIYSVFLTFPQKWGMVYITLNIPIIYIFVYII